MLSKADLFARLAEGHAARVTVITPNARLAQALVSDFDSFQAGKNLKLWEAPDILPFGAFVERLYEDALYSDGVAEVPLLLTPAQEELVWREAISQSGRELFAIDQAAAQCRDAWRLAHAWRLVDSLRRGQGNEDAAAFSDWAAGYRKKTAAEVDSARLPDLVQGFFDKLKLPERLVAYGFDLLPPQTQGFLEAFEKNGGELDDCHPGKKTASPARTSFLSAREELEAAAKWARARLENRAPSPILARIGVVVPDLQARRREVARVFSRVMGRREAFNLSLGEPLSDYAPVSFALELLEFVFQPVDFEKASRLIRSPFLGAAEGELLARARLDVRIRRDLAASVTLGKLLALTASCPALRRILEALFALRQSEPQSPHGWARHFSALLEAAGFPGERAPDSCEFQVRAKWHEALGEFARLERVSPRLPCGEALSVLRKICADTLFQPESGAAPVQVLGILESAGIEFDHLWVSGLTDEAWPLAAHANPFLPIALQKKAGIPEAAAESSLALDRRITEGWLGAADEVVLSFHEKDEDRDVAPSPLILGVAEKKVAVPDFPRLRDLVFAQRKISSVEDRVAPAVTATQVRGGTRVLADQAACPFRAFARHRLRAETLEAPLDGLGAAERGSLLHSLMKNLWLSLKDSSSLRKDVEPAIAAAAHAAVKELRLEGRFAELERARLARLARQWLEVEKTRPPFEVVLVEDKRKIKIHSLELDARIDRMDRLAGGGHALIDYKTSRNPSPKHWEPPRPDDPQLPLYAVSAKEDVVAVAFAKVRPGDMKYMGFSRDEKSIEGVKKAQAWKPLLRAWKAEAEALGAAFASGEARVDPKRELATCRYCGLQPLCRVYEKINVLSEVAEEGEE